MNHDDDPPDQPLDPPADLYNPQAWCTEESTAMHPGETSEQWMLRLLMTAEDHGDHDFVRRVKDAIAGSMLLSRQPIPEA